MSTWSELRAAAAGRLGDTDVRWMVERASGMDAAELIVEGDTIVPSNAAAHLEAMIDRRAAGEPLQYVLGEWGFAGLDLLVDRRVLIPRPETEVTTSIAIAEAARSGARTGRRGAWSDIDTEFVVVDLGTGSGAIALALAAALPDALVWATDASDDALAVARANVAGSGHIGTRVRVAGGSWFDALPKDLRGGVRVLVSNPPYIGEHEDLPPEVIEWEPRAALVSGPTGLEAIAVIVAGALEWLEPQGAVVVELAPHQGEPAVNMALTAGFAEAEVFTDLAERPRVLVARRG